MKKITFIFLLIINLSNGQEPVDILIDSLNFESNLKQRIALITSISSELVESDWDKAISYLELAEREVESSENAQEELALVYKSYGNIFYSKDILDITLEYYLKAYNLYKELGNETEFTLLENDLAIIYARLNNNEKALEYFNNVYEYQLKHKDSLRLAQILNNIGNLFLKRNVDSSLHYFNKSLEISKRLNNKELYGYVYANLGRAYSINNDLQNAKINFDSALSFSKNSDNDILKNLVNNSIAEFFLKVEENDSSIVYAKRTMDLNTSSFYSFRNQNAANTLYQAYKNKNDYQNAVYYFETYNKIRDSINVEEKALNVERLKLQQEFRVKEKIQEFEKEKERSKYIMIGLSLVASILLLIIIVFRYKATITKNNLEKKLLIAEQNELRQNLESKNKTLISKAMAEMHRTDIINSILTDLKQVKRKAVKKETQQAIDYILVSLQRDLNSNVWKEFEVSFEQVHESFCKALNLKHPDLSPKDRRLCSLLYLDLTSKEIALITGQSFKSIENARTRLRKKLNLTNEKVNLSNYMNSL